MNERFEEVTCTLHYSHKFDYTNDVRTTYLGSYMAKDELRTFLVDNHIPFDVEAIESVTSYIKGRQQHRINTMVEALRNHENKIKNNLRQHRNELLMCDRYNLNSLRGVINTINALHERQAYYEIAVRQRDFNFRRSDMDAINYNFDTMMYLDNAREEHVVTYKEAVKAARDFLD